MSANEANLITTFIEKVLRENIIPAVSIAWSKDGKSNKFAIGMTNAENPKRVNTKTLFQASSLSKVVSAAIVLDLIKEHKWNINSSLAKFVEGGYGSSTLKTDKYYDTLTIAMVLGQCSGLPNWFQEGEKEKFFTEPGRTFNYSGVAFSCLKEVIEKKLNKGWEAISQEFFAKVGMHDSTFKHLDASHMQGKRDLAEGHDGDGKPVPEFGDINSPEIPAGSLLTTGEDFLKFLQYCFKDENLNKNLLTGMYALNKSFPETPFAEKQIKWSLGMGVYEDDKRKIAFHWGNNTGWNAFCAVDITTGDCVVCMINSANGPKLIQGLCEPVIGNMDMLFSWLYTYCNFKDAKITSSTQELSTLFPLIVKLIEKTTLPQIGSQSFFSQTKVPVEEDKEEKKIPGYRKDVD